MRSLLELDSLAGEFDEMLAVMESAFRDFENALPDKPRLVNLPCGPVFRYAEKNIHQALVQKLARLVSALRAAYLLLRNGYVQEQGMLQRALDETVEDIMFLTHALADDDHTSLRERFLAAFWQEEFEKADPLECHQKRDMVPRQKIRAYLSRNVGDEVSPHVRVRQFRTLSKAYSGYIHGASPHIMEMYCSDPPGFCTQGMLGSPRILHGARDLWNYMYRGLGAHAWAAKAFGSAEHFADLSRHLDRFEAKAKRRRDEGIGGSCASNGE